MQETEKYDLDIVKTEIINTVLVVISYVGVTAYLIGLTRYFTTGFQYTFVTDFLILIPVIYIAINRKSLANRLKATVVILLIFLLVISDVFIYGVLSAARIYLLLVPFFAVLFLNYRITLVLFLFALVSFLSIGLMHSTGYLSIPSGYDPAIYVTRFYPWLINAVHITAVALVIFLITRKFTESSDSFISMLQSYKNTLEQRVQERTEELYAANEELRAANEELQTQAEDLDRTLRDLQQAQNQLIHSEKMASLGVLASGVAHEINNPLNFISGSIMGVEHFLEDHLDGHSDHLGPLLKSMQEGVKRASVIVAGLNYYTHQAGEEILKGCNINTILDRCLDMIGPQLTEKIKIVKSYDDIPATFKCREAKLHQAFLNILSNALDSIAENGEITVMTSCLTGMIEVSIQDTGCGIAAENILKVTDPFFTTKPPGSGTGLGLYIASGIISEHNGSLQMESEVGKGTRVKVSFPV